MFASPVPLSQSSTIGRASIKFFEILLTLPIQLTRLVFPWLFFVAETEIAVEWFYIPEIQAVIERLKTITKKEYSMVKQRLKTRATRIDCKESYFKYKKKCLKYLSGSFFWFLYFKWLLSQNLRTALRRPVNSLSLNHRHGKFVKNYITIFTSTSTKLTSFGKRSREESNGESDKRDVGDEEEIGK